MAIASIINEQQTKGNAMKKHLTLLIAAMLVGTLATAGVSLAARTPTGPAGTHDTDPLPPPPPPPPK